ncbi:arginase [Limnohabitans sp.]|uniref:arginase n=1 Tax=Limnohabitans sp. TaxID=1907725 RepID=UPI00286F1329|nr:arginase [Limnohabitans sp.]
MKNVSLIGAPTDIGASDIGARMGPAALRVAGIVQAISRYGNFVRDEGDISGPINPEAAPVNGYRHLAEVIHWNQSLHNMVYRELAQGQLPIVMGGDHCLALGSISAVARWCREQKKTLRVLWLDAHADFNISVITPSGNLHGMPLACLCGLGPDELTGLSGQSPALKPADVRWVGIRSVDAGERQLLHDHKAPVFDMRHIDEVGMRQTISQALQGIDSNTHLHVSLDVDFLDPGIAPGVGTTVQGGPNYREAQLCMEMIADTQCLGSLDIVELNPALDHQNQTALLAVDLVESLFGKSTLLRANSSHLSN